MAKPTSAIDVRGRRRGFTLIESTIASVFLALAVVGVASSVTASANQLRHMEETAMAVSLAKQLMEEISAKAYGDLGDYINYTDTSAAIAAAGTSATDLAPGVTYTRTVTVTYRDSFNGTTDVSGPFATVRVRVTIPSGQIVEITKVFSETNLILN